MVTRPETGPRTDAAAPPGRGRARRRVVAPTPSPEQVLAARARHLLDARRSGPPARWMLPGFAADVELVRRQLGPLRHRRMLVASFERESARLAAQRRLAADPAGPALPLDPLEAAYAVRWLELAPGGEPRPAWLDWLGRTPDRAAPPAAAAGASPRDGQGSA